MLFYLEENRYYVGLAAFVNIYIGAVIGRQARGSYCYRTDKWIWPLKNPENGFLLWPWAI